MFRIVRTATRDAWRAQADTAHELRAAAEVLRGQLDDAEDRIARLHAVLAETVIDSTDRMKRLEADLAAAEQRAEAAAGAVSRAETAAGGADPWGEREWDAAPAEPEEPRTTECQLCGAPGGYPYCNAGCRAADLADHDCQWPEDCPGCSVG